MLLALLPLLSARHLPLLDAPGHEARLAVLWNILVAKTGSQHYEFAGFLLPNVAFDIIGMALYRFFDPEMIGKIVFGLTAVMTLTGVWVLNRVGTGRWSVVPLASGLLLYNLTAILGFFSYEFGLALVPWALVVQLKLRTAPIWIRLVVGSISATVLLFCHLFAFGIYGAISMSFAVASIARREASWMGAAERFAELLPALAVLGSMPTMHMGHSHFAGISPTEKLLGLLKAVTCGSIPGDLAFVVGALALVVLLLTRSTVRIGTGFALAVVSLSGLYLALPDKLASGSYVDSRMPVAVGLTLLAGLDARLRPGRATILLGGVVGTALFVRQAAVASLWVSFDPGITQLVSVLDGLPDRAIVMQAECEPAATDIRSVYRERQPSMTHLSAFAAFADRRFAAATWAAPGQQTIAVAPNLQPFHALQESFGASTCSSTEHRRLLQRIRDLAIRERVERAVFFLLIRPTDRGGLIGEAELIGPGADFELYRVPDRLE